MESEILIINTYFVILVFTIEISEYFNISKFGFSFLIKISIFFFLCTYRKPPNKLHYIILIFFST